jgi:hypothetical protein|tara:strand:- start:40 stop:561 length:522 start_codon:yes stop_codon:yes gene_type:complete
MESDISNADNSLHVEFYKSQEEGYKDVPFVRIHIPGDKTTVIDQPVREDHKERFVRQWLYFQMKNNEGAEVYGTMLSKWNADEPKEFDKFQMEELQILKYQTVEQVSTSTDSQLQRIGMSGFALRDKARAYLARQTQTAASTALEDAQKELAILKAQVALLSKPKMGRPKKED